MVNKFKNENRKHRVYAMVVCTLLTQWTETVQMQTQPQFFKQLCSSLSLNAFSIIQYPASHCGVPVSPQPANKSTQWYSTNTEPTCDKRTSTESKLYQRQFICLFTIPNNGKWCCRTSSPSIFAVSVALTLSNGCSSYTTIAGCILYYECKAEKILSYSNSVSKRASNNYFTNFPVKAKNGLCIR